MDVTQIAGQNLGKVGIEADSLEVQKANDSVSKRVAFENKKAAQAQISEGTRAEQMNDDMKKSQLKDLVESMNKNLDPFNTSLKFGFHDKSDTYYVSVVDTKTNDIIRKFPTDEAIELSLKMKEVVGMIFDKKG